MVSEAFDPTNSIDFKFEPVHITYGNSVMDGLSVRINLCELGINAHPLGAFTKFTLPDTLIIVNFDI